VEAPDDSVHAMKPVAALGHRDERAHVTPAIMLWRKKMWREKMWREKMWRES
jgi:hypothetical protein